MRKYKIIVIDDEIISADGIAQLLQLSKLSVEVTAVFYSSVNALNYIKQNPVDLIVTDLNMPEISGIDLIKEIKSINDIVQFVILTGFGTLNYAKEAMKFGVKYFLQKPCMPIDLYDSIQRAIIDFDMTEQNELRRKKEIIEKIWNGGSIKNDEFKPFAFLVYDVQAHSMLQTGVSELLESNNISWVIGNIDQVIIYYFFGNTAEQISAIVQQLDFSAMNSGTVLCIDACRSISSIKTKLKQTINKMQLSFYLAEPILLLNEIPDRSSDTVHFPNEVMALQRYFQLNSYSSRHALYVELDRIFLEAKKEWILPIRFKQIILELLTMFSIKNNADYSKISELRSEIEKINKAEQLNLFAKQTIQSILGESDVISKQGTIADNLNAIIEKYYANSELTLKWISRNILFLNPEYMGKAYYKETQQKFSTKLLSYRMEMAARLFKEEAKVYKVAERVGYTDRPEYFSKLFKQYFGVTPKEFIEVS